jgi:hypothetical protein
MDMLFITDVKGAFLYFPLPLRGEGGVRGEKEKPFDSAYGAPPPVPLPESMHFSN